MRLSAQDISTTPAYDHFYNLEYDQAIELSQKLLK